MRGLLAGILLATLAHPGQGEERNWDFRAKTATSLVRTGPNASTYISQSNDGLRIHLPPGHSKLPAIGLVSRQVLAGDFECTLSYRDFSTEQPTSGTGSGVSLYITFATPEQHAATVGHYWHPKEGWVWKAHWAVTQNGKRQHRSHTIPTDRGVPIGQLRFIRNGNVLRYFIGTGEGEFQQIHELEFETADVDQIRLAADAGGSTSPIDVRITSLSVRVDALLDGPRGIGMARWGRVYIATGVISGVVALAGIAWWVFIRRRPARPATPTA